MQLHFFFEAAACNCSSQTLCLFLLSILTLCQADLALECQVDLIAQFLCAVAVFLTAKQFLVVFTMLVKQIFLF